MITELFFGLHWHSGIACGSNSSLVFSSDSEFVIVVFLQIFNGELGDRNVLLVSIDPLESTFNSVLNDIIEDLGSSIRGRGFPRKRDTCFLCCSDFKAARLSWFLCSQSMFMISEEDSQS